MANVETKYFDSINRLASIQVYLGMPNISLAALAGQHASFADVLASATRFPLLEWNSNLQSLVGEAILLKLAVSEIRSVPIRLKCNPNEFSLGGRLNSQQWSDFVCELKEIKSAKFGIVLAFERSLSFSQAVYDRLLNLRDLIYPLPLSIECSHRSWSSPSAIKAVRASKLNIVQTDLPNLTGFNARLQNYDSRFACLRLLGRNQSTWFSKEADKKYAYDYNRNELAELATFIKGLRKESESVYVVGANMPANVGLSNLLELAHIYLKS